MNGIKGRSGLVMAAIALALAAPAAAQFSDGYNFLKAVRDKDVMKAKGFIDKPGSTIINARDGDSGETALMIAIKRRDTPWMGFLLQNGADPNLRDRDGNTPLGVAAMNAFPDGVRVMLASRAQVDGANNRGETPLIKAVHMRDATSVQYLLNAGADPDRTDNLAGMSARDYAARDIRSGPIGKALSEAPKKGEKKSMGPSL
ncbi:ankyrin repeat domain-containing protein [Sandaracinobacter neustonicus]|uniref:Ankyrin repeat domain-containing protein n=1 Tax=Sandaracinobacter neustonicus TaxID=1715348 RepID=A0A501XGN0_9SPHN|nr:ankyrin repeat domain-containing protein [Sandaracinobacter neustonicus]TPE59463.1 ankyrin repeat domain-containing protein [Sandaracinobacter neustonicus]